MGTHCTPDIDAFVCFGLWGNWVGSTLSHASGGSWILSKVWWHFRDKNVLLFISPCSVSVQAPPEDARVTSTPNPLERRPQPIITADEHVGYKCWRRWGEQSSTGLSDPHDKCTVVPDGSNLVVTVHLWRVPNYPSGTTRVLPPVREWQIAHLAHCQCQF